MLARFVGIAARLVGDLAINGLNLSQNNPGKLNLREIEFLAVDNMPSHTRKLKPIEGFRFLRKGHPFSTSPMKHGGG